MKGLSTWIWIIGGIVISLLVLLVFFSIFQKFTIDKHKQDSLQSFNSIITDINTLCDFRESKSILKTITLSDLVKTIYASEDSETRIENEKTSGKNICLNFTDEIKCETLNCEIIMDYFSTEKQLMGLINKITGNIGYSDYQVEIFRDVEKIHVIIKPVIIEEKPSTTISTTTSTTISENILLFEDFSGVTSVITTFLNYWRLVPQQWKLQNGNLIHDYKGRSPGTTNPNMMADDALAGYFNQDAYNWDNYIVTAKVKIQEGDAGVWFHGTYEQSSIPAQRVTGYFCMINKNEVRLSKIKTHASSPNNEYCFNNGVFIIRIPKNYAVNVWHNIKVEIKGDQIKCFVDDLENPVITATDDEFTHGSVGFKTYRAVAYFDDLKVVGID